MNEQEFHVIIEQDSEGYFVGTVPGLAGCHTQARSIDVLMERVREAIELCREVEETPSSQFVGMRTVTV